MPQPTITPVTDPVGFHVFCGEHGLARTVSSERHATNLLALHLRIDHADEHGDLMIEANLTEAAQWLVALKADRNLVPAYRAVLSMWAMLVGLDHDRDAAVVLAEQIASLPDDLLAYTTPF
jgi:hypothetical protein